MAFLRCLNLTICFLTVIITERECKYSLSTGCNLCIAALTGTVAAVYDPSQHYKKITYLNKGKLNNIYM